MFGITKAPEIDRPGLVWFNAPEPLSLPRLRGRVVLLDFWTLCCVNCLHVQPVLRRVQEHYAEAVTVIGVHSPKFPAERQARSVADAIARYRIRHPVVHDPDRVLWSEYAVRAWPTLVFLSPDGCVIGQMAGEPNGDLLVAGLGDMLKQFHARGELSPRPLAAPQAMPRRSRLSFPGKIKRLEPGGLWAVADGGHNQVVVLDDAGGEVARHGSGRAEWRDGPAAEAGFDSPQGLACDATAIYVADTGNHAIRRIDRATGAVTTLAGTGRRGWTLRGRHPASAATLASPWDLALIGRRLFFANAGTHQIGELDLATMTVSAVAGSGAEGLADGPAAEALLAQPSGLVAARDGRALYFVDAESSSVRRLVLDPAPRVETLAGKGLFAFGHRNGAGDEALFQHPLGLDLADDRLVIADSYNNAVRVLSMKGGEVADLVNGGWSCAESACRGPSEPAGIAAAGPDRWLISDTNNHRILEYRPRERLMRTWAA